MRIFIQPRAYSRIDSRALSADDVVAARESSSAHDCPCALLCVSRRGLGAHSRVSFLGTHTRLPTHPPTLPTHLPRYAEALEMYERASAVAPDDKAR